MPRLSESTIGNAYTSDFCWSVLSDLSTIGSRMGGQDGERRGAEIVRDAFETAGLRDVQISEFDIDGWWRGSASITVEDATATTEWNKSHQLLALPGTPSGTASAELVYAGYGTPEELEDSDTEGNIVMVSNGSPEGYDRWFHRMEKYVNVYEAGASGFVFRNDREGCLPPTGEIGYHSRPGPIPAVGVSSEVGENLYRRCKDSPLSIEIQVDCKNEPATSRNVEGVLGPADGEEILVTAHVDNHDIAEGALDNGAGCALLAELARLLKPHEDELSTRLRFVTFGSEEIGLFGAYHHAETRDLNDVRCVLNVDGAGQSRNLSIGTNGFEEIETTFCEATDAFDVPIELDRTISPHGDQWPFIERGIPAAFVSSAYSGPQGSSWAHTHADTLDKVDQRDLRDLAVLIAEGILVADDADDRFEHRTPAEIRDALPGGYARELKVAGRWHFDDE